MLPAISRACLSRFVQVVQDDRPVQSEKSLLFAASDWLHLRKRGGGSAVHSPRTSKLFVLIRKSIEHRFGILERFENRRHSNLILANRQKQLNLNKENFVVSKWSIRRIQRVSLDSLLQSGKVARTFKFIPSCLRAFY